MQGCKAYHQSTPNIPTSIKDNTIAMVRSILRNVQNSLVLGAVALCILAFQRLESLDSVVHKPPSSLWPHPPPLDDRFSDEGSGSPDLEESSASLRIGSHHELVFGREIHIGLFRFPLPVLKKHPKSLLNDSYNSKESDDKTKNLRSVQEKRKRESPREGTQPDGQVAIVISIRECNEKTIDDAAVFKESLPSDSGIQLYAILDDKEGAVKCADKLRGYEPVSASKVLRNITTSCLTEEESSLLIANTLDAALVLHVPLPSIVVPMESDTDLPLLAGGPRGDAKKINIQGDGDKTILMTRPLGRESKNGPATNLIAEYCNKKNPANSTESFAIGSPWRQCTRRPGEATCRISKSLGIATLAHCPLPERKELSEKRMSTDDAEKCRKLWLKWLQARSSLMEKQGDNDSNLKSS